MSGAGTSARGRPGETSPGSIVVLQVISVEYGKAARGGAAARLRATLPTAFPVPTSTSDTVHKVGLWAGNDYRPSSSVDALGPVPPGPLLGGRVRLDRADDGAIVLVDSAGGARVVVDERWTQLRFNLIEHSHDHSWYRATTINAIRVLPPATGQVFGGEPAVSRDLRAPIERRRKRA